MLFHVLPVLRESEKFDFVSKICILELLLETSSDNDYYIAHLWLIHFFFWKSPLLSLKFHFVVITFFTINVNLHWGRGIVSMQEF